MEKGGGHPFHTRGQYLTCVRSSSISEQAFSLSLFKTSISFLLKKKVNSITDESLLTVVTVVLVCTPVLDTLQPLVCHCPALLLLLVQLDPSLGARGTLPAL